MAHGGTSFGLWAGADRPFLPDTSSYDYDAPISEAGWVTEKFTRIRELFAKHLLPGETLPEPPAANRVITLAPFVLGEGAPLFDNLPAARISDERPQPIEVYNHSRGCTVYRATLPAGGAGTVFAHAVHDFAWVFLDGQLMGAMDRRGRRFSVDIPAREKDAQLDILVESVGRVNFGQEIHDRKGLHAPVQFALMQAGSAATELTGWTIFPLPLDERQLAGLRLRASEAGDAKQPAFWRAHFEVAQPGDTFLDLRSWGKGVVWVNGHCLGRFWNIGPTQTMYCPGPWLRAGRNEVIVLDLLGPREAKLAGLAQPILDELHPENDFARPVRAGGTFSVAGLAPAAEGVARPEVEWQETKFAAPARGRYLCFEVVSAHDGKPFAAVAELDAVSPSGDAMGKTAWKIFWADSEEIAALPGEATNCIDGQPHTFWHSDVGLAPPHPHRIVIDLGEAATIAGVRQLPRAGGPDETGRVKAFRVYVSDRPFGLTPP